MQIERLIKKLNVRSVFLRKLILGMLKKTEKRDKKYGPDDPESYNFNIRTDYSFSPYNPTMAAFMAYKSGVSVAGICDYGTTAGCQEFFYGCKKLGIIGIGGFDAVLGSEKLGNCTASFFGVCDGDFGFEPLLETFRINCLSRAQKATEAINGTLSKYGISIDYEKDVYKFTQSKKKGTVTLKHVFRAVGESIIQKYGKGKNTADFLRNELCLDIDESEYNLLCDHRNVYYIYDLIVALKKYFKDNDCMTVGFPDVKSYTSVADDSGVIAAYHYKCKYRWLEIETETEKTVAEFSELLDIIKAEGFNAVCLSVREYSKSALVKYIKAVKDKEMLVVLNEKSEYPHSLFGVDCPEESRAYVEACAFAIAGNALSIAECHSDGIFSDKTIIKCPSFEERLNIFASIGKKNK